MFTSSKSSHLKALSVVLTNFVSGDPISEVVSSDQENIELVTNVGRASSCPVMAVLSLGHRGF